ncbi:MAG: hypothetical protein GX564_11070 [Oligosphaeraceae bacterium]|nr:hypothetical protein [Oligosphaeraceae bacterium]
MKDNVLLAISQLTRFHLVAEPGPQSCPPVMLVAVRLLLGIIYAWTALLILWIVKQPLVGAVLATLAVSALRGFLTGWRDRLLPLRLAGLFFPSLKTVARDPVEQQFQSAALNWVMLARPLGLFLLLLYGCWYWLVPVAGLAAAFAEELCAPEDDQRSGDWRPWALAVGVSLLFFLLASKLSTVFANHLLTGLFVCIITWLLSSWLKRRVAPLCERALATYCGELAVIIMLLLGIAF